MVNRNVIAFVIPAYNEELNIAKVIDEINNEFDKVKIIVVNDASKDRTRDIVTEKALHVYHSHLIWDMLWHCKQE